ncbi:glycosyltransferase family A protein [Chryseobacterium sp. MYb264]|uniref:glycosyltransferase family 2 protein n=1 Tax=Chryseobacterium sp. MYb264 TaxID=2745153 RepID=UPI002E164382|nr:glycosyltransferase family A protein [Chryseobacterium sp. MYb264]
MKKFSVLIANYNNGKYFKECYDSIISQSYPNWEVIIVDDASTDDSVETIRNIIKDDNRFKLYENKDNRGCGFTKGHCMDFATGEICGYLDPDDALYPQALEKSVEAYNRHPKIVATYSRMTMCNDKLEGDTVFTKTKAVYNDKYFFNYPIQLAHFFTFKKEVYDKTSGINPDLCNAVDQDLYLKILDHGDPAFVDENLYKYRLHSQGISQFKSKNSAKESFAKVIFDTMNRRSLKSINKVKVPQTYNNSTEIFDLLVYQTKFLYRLKTKAKLFLGR